MKKRDFSFRLYLEKMREIIIVSFLASVITLSSCVKPPEVVKGDIVINELLPRNNTTAQDQNGEYDDWVELYNLSAEERDISGFYLSDDRDDRRKWKFPEGTVIGGNSYLIIWCDKDTDQQGLHADFKLSAEGEEVLLSTPDGDLLNDVVYQAQSRELSYSRNPDGKGSFRWQTPTFDRSNSSSE